jgi:hypothetical protein
MEFDLLDGDVQASILARREAEAESERNRTERKFYFNRALFHRYKEDQATIWVRDSIFQGIVKNYKLKKSGVKMTLDQKHLYDKVVGPVEKIIKRILKQEPMVILSEVSEKQALMAATKAAAASVARGGKLNEKRKAAEEKKRKEEEAKKSEEEEKVNAKKRKKSRKSNAIDEEDAAGGAVRLEDMTPLELDQTYMHAFNVFADRMTAIYCKCLNSSMKDLTVSKQTRIAYFTSFEVRAALQEAEEKLQKSPITALLPPVQFKEKVLVAAAKMLHSWDLMEETGDLLCASFKIKDKTWAQKGISCLSSCLIMKYSLDEKNRLRGEHIAANIIQGLIRGFLVRCKLRRIWDLANQKYEKEYEKYLQHQLEEKYLKEMQEAKALQIQSEVDSHSRRLLLQKIGVEWAEAYIHAVSVKGVVIQINMRIGGKLPTKDYFRNKNVKCTARMFQKAEQLRDSNATEYTQTSSSASTMSDMTQPHVGQIEVLIDDPKATEDQTKDWNKYGSNSILPSSLTWDSTTKLKKSKLINVFDLHDDGSELDVATCFLDIKGMDFNACYNVKLVVNPHYNPNSSYNEEVKATVAVVEFITSPNPPRPPRFTKPDIIHFDHAIAVTKDRKIVDDVPLNDHLYNTDDGSDDILEDDKDNDGLSVVDRLEKFKFKQLERKQTAFDMKTMKKGKFHLLIMFILT